MGGKGKKAGKIDMKTNLPLKAVPASWTFVGRVHLNGKDYR